MGWLDRLLGRGGDGQEEEQSRFSDRTVARLHKKLMNKWHQTLERKRVVQLLANIGSDEAVIALLGRFTYVTDGSIVDEDEKTLVYEIIKSMGTRAVPALERFIREEAAIYWPLKALTEITGQDYAVKVILDALAGITDRFDRSMERMNNLVSCLRDYQHPDVLRKLVSLARDESEEIRFLAVDGLSTFDDQQDAVDAIIERLLDEEETIRVKTYIMDLLIQRRWKVKKYKKDLAGRLPEDYFIDDTGVVQRRF